MNYDFHQDSVNSMLNRETHRKYKFILFQKEVKLVKEFDQSCTHRKQNHKGKQENYQHKIVFKGKERECDQG